MSLDHAILGFLNYGPLSGYDLKKVFDVSVRHFWPADQSQIYRTLSRLVEQDWAEMEVVEQTERPDRKVYRITEAGRAELLRWLASPTPERVSRSAALIQVFFFGQLADEVIVEKFEAYARSMRRTLENYEQLSGELVGSLPEACTPREHFFWMQTLDLGIRTTRENLAWAQNVIEQLKAGNAPQK
jgi:PadR family transcriptional regulator, regulatory protein AphA